MPRFICVFFLITYDTGITKAIDLGEKAKTIYNDPGFTSVMKKYWDNAKTIFKSENDDLEDLFGNGNMYNNTDLEETDKAIQLFAPIYKKRVQKKGIDFIKIIGQYIEKRLFLKKKQVTLVVEKKTKHYNSKLRTYFNFLLRSKSYNDYERHFVLLDMVNFANFLMNSISMSLVKDLVPAKRRTSTGGKLDITAAVFNFNQQERTRELIYICKMMHVCRQYPGYSDYFVSILGDVLKLYDMKFIYVVTKLYNILNNKKGFFKTILNRDIITWFANKTDNMYHVADVDNIRIVVSELRSAITWRQRVLRLPEGVEKNKAKALAILIDIVDRAFDKYDSETLYNKYDEASSTIRVWGSNLSNKIDSVLISITDNFESTLNSELSHVAKEEMKTLADIVFKGKSDNEFMSRYLMRTGSRFLKESHNNTITV